MSIGEEQGKMMKDYSSSKERFIQVSVMLHPAGEYPNDKRKYWDKYRITLVLLTLFAIFGFSFSEQIS